MSAVLKTVRQDLTAGVLDRAGICASLVCLVQCLALPLVVVFTPMAAAGLAGGEAFHLLLLAVILPVSLAAFALGYLRHGNRLMLVPAGIGLGVLIIAALLDAFSGLGPWTVAGLTSAGGLFLILGHGLNIRFRRRACLRPG